MMVDTSIEVPHEDSCAFCDYLAGRRPYTIVCRSDLVAVLVTREQRGVGHVLVIPVRHYPTLLEATPDERHALIDTVAAAAAAIDDTLQVVTVGGDYDSASTDRMKNRKTVSFNFESLANRFDQLRTSNPGMTSWAFAGELNNYFKANSDTQAIGGDLAYRYATTGGYGDLDWMGVRNRMSGMTGTAWQTLTASTSVNPWTALQAGLSLIADQTVGLPSPITPMSPPSADDLAFAALNASAHKPSWMEGSGGHVLP